jgi:hypothetical protein
MRRGGVVRVVLLAGLAASAQPSLPPKLQHAFDDAERRLPRLPPSAFPELPANVAAELTRRGCTIPQTTYTNKPHNVIRGEFARAGQRDWAVLCSVKGTSSILVFWNGAAKNPAALAPLEDRGFLQMTTADEAGYSRAIDAVGKDFIMRHYEAYGGVKPPPVTHQGINDAFVEKASVVWYFHDGRWLRLTGAD